MPGGADVAVCLSEYVLQLLPIETDDDLAVNLCHRGRHEPERFELVERLLVLGDIALDVWDAFLGKKLFHLSTEQSARLRVDDYLLGHGSPSRLMIDIFPHMPTPSDYSCGSGEPKRLQAAQVGSAGWRTSHIPASSAPLK